MRRVEVSVVVVGYGGGRSPASPATRPMLCVTFSHRHQLLLLSSQYSANAVESMYIHACSPRLFARCHGALDTVAQQQLDPLRFPRRVARRPHWSDCQR